MLDCAVLCLASEDLVKLLIAECQSLVSRHAMSPQVLKSCRVVQPVSSPLHLGT